MGGNALKNTFTRRYLTPEFKELSIEMKAKCIEAFNSIPYILRHYNNKYDHGDMDILLVNDTDRQKMKDVIEKKFKPNEIVINDSVHSFDYQEFQIDIMPQYVKNWLTSISYFDLDPTGNLMGKLAHKFGLKYGHEGLIYPYRSENGKVMGKMVVSKNPSKIFKFLGFDYERHMRGFDDVEDIFEYVVSSKHFVPDIFAMDNLSQIDRKRNRKRPTYQKFLQYIQTKDFPDEVLMRSFNEDKTKYLDYIKMYFPEAKLDIRLKLFKDKEDRISTIYDKFNGKLIQEKYPHLTGTALGNAIIKFKAEVPEWEKFVLKAKDSDIWKVFETHNKL